MNKKKICAIAIATSLALISYGCNNSYDKNGQAKNEETSQKFDDSSILEFYGKWEDYSEDEGKLIKEKYESLKIVDGKKVYIPKEYENTANGDYIINDGAIYSKDGKTLLSAPLYDKDFCIMEGVETVKISAISLNADIYFGIEPDPKVVIESITFPESVKEIIFDDSEFFEFHRCNKIEKINIKGNKLSVDNVSELLHHFGKIAADNITLPADVGRYEDGMCIYKDYIVKYSGEKTELEIPEGIKGIADYAFTSFYMDEHDDDDYGESSYYRGNKKIEKIILPKSMEKIGNGAFYNCRKLKSIVTKDGCKIKSIGEKVFKGTKVKEDSVIK
ncbi:MAG: hypothetical protein E7254_02025 [Lachnospiraceae bacterium]|nr:hypothetical protein [Lachnospiraceae bacterium]